jgi:hypothetical protein
MTEKRYNIIRFYRYGVISRSTVQENVTLEEAQRHCNDPETNSKTATGKTARRRTTIVGPWFDGYEEIK